MEQHYNELEYLIEAAHTVGWMEANGEIEIENEGELTEFLVDIYNEWDKNIKTKSFSEFSAYAILEHYKSNN